VLSSVKGKKLNRCTLLLVHDNNSSNAHRRLFRDSPLGKGYHGDPWLAVRVPLILSQLREASRRTTELPDPRCRLIHKATTIIWFRNNNNNKYNKGGGLRDEFPIKCFFVAYSYHLCEVPGTGWRHVESDLGSCGGISRTAGLAKRQAAARLSKP
jgi:hypothetical protein